MFDVDSLVTKLQDGYYYIYNFLNSLPKKRYYIGVGPQYPITSYAKFEDEGMLFANDILAMRINKNNTVEIFIDLTTDGELTDENDFWSKDFQEDFYEGWQVLYNDYQAILSILLWAKENKKLSMSESNSINYQSKKNGTIVDNSSSVEINLKDYDIIL